jgi:hypothetical protein
VVSEVTLDSSICTPPPPNPFVSVPPGYATGFYFFVEQQSTTGTGVLTISNIHYSVVADAPNGPVLVGVSGMGDSPTNVQFQANVSNAKIGPKAPLTTSTATALGATKTGPFSTATKVAKLGQYVTWRFTGGSALAGKTVEIWMASKNASGSWGSWTLLTKRLADGNGNVYFWWRSNAPAWVSVRAHVSESDTYGETWWPAAQARWK